MLHRFFTRLSGQTNSGHAMKYMLLVAGATFLLVGQALGDQSNDKLIQDKGILNEWKHDAGEFSMLARIIVYTGSALHDFMSTVFVCLETVVAFICGTFTFVVYLVFGAIDIIVRGPVYLLKWGFQFVVLALEIALFLTGDARMLSLDVVLSSLAKCLSYTIVFIIETCRVVVVGIVTLTTQTLLSYICVLDFITFRIMYPVLDAIVRLMLTASVIWLLLSVLFAALCGTNRNVWPENGVKVAILLPFLYIAYKMCIAIFSWVLHYIVHPVIYAVVIFSSSYALWHIFLNGFLPLIRQHAQNARRSFRILFLERLQVQTFYGLCCLYIRRLRTPELTTNVIRPDLEECVICFEENPSFVMILPCGHNTVCSACASQIVNQDGRCPLCRRWIEDVLDFDTH